MSPPCHFPPVRTELCGECSNPSLEIHSLHFVAQIIFALNESSRWNNVSSSGNVNKYKINSVRFYFRKETRTHETRAQWTFCILSRCRARSLRSRLRGERDREHQSVRKMESLKSLETGSKSRTLRGNRSDRSEEKRTIKSHEIVIVNRVAR